MILFGVLESTLQYLSNDVLWMLLAVTETEKCGFKEESIFSRVGNFTFVKKSTNN